MQRHDECGATTRLWGAYQGSLSDNSSCVPLSTWLLPLCARSRFCIRGRSQPRASCSNKTPSPLLSRTAASCLEPKRGESSCLSSLSSLVNPSTGRKASRSLGTPLRAALRWALGWPWWGHPVCVRKIYDQEIRKYSWFQVPSRSGPHTFLLQISMLCNSFVWTF